MKPAFRAPWPGCATTTVTSVLDGGEFRLRFDCDLDDVVPPFAEKFISSGDALQRKRVRQKGSQIQASMSHQLHQPLHALLAAGAERRDDLVIAESRGEWLQLRGGSRRVVIRVTAVLWCFE